MPTARLAFQPFDEHGPLRIYSNGFLPHWRQDGGTYFATFRLADSIPQGVLDEWAYERKCWLAARGIDVSQPAWQQAFRRLDKQERLRFERHFVGTLFAYLDRGHGDCVLQDPVCGQIVADALQYFHGDRVRTGDFVVMPNHCHALLTPLPNYELEDILHSIKSYTANEINRRIGRAGAVWQKESYDHIVRDGEELLRIQRYIQANPEQANVAAGRYVSFHAEYELEA